MVSSSSLVTFTLLLAARPWEFRSQTGLQFAVEIHALYEDIISGLEEMLKHHYRVVSLWGLKH